MLLNEEDLTEYEGTQVHAIRAWKQQEPSVGSKAVGYLFAPIVWLFNKIIPQAALRGALDLSDTAGKRMAQIGTLKSDAGVKEFSELRHAPLHECDRLADSVHN